MTNKWKKIAGALVALGGLAYLALAPEATETPGQTEEVRTETRSGRSKAAAEIPAGLELPAPTGGRTVEHAAYVSSYNTETLIPNWVAYELTAEEASGKLGRSGNEFRMDPDLRGCTQAMREDYSGSGWTKGHMMPAADAAFSSSSMAQTFYFTNICPQDETLNAGDWQFLEKKVRGWAKRYGSVFVVTGPIVGTNRYGTIGEREVTVPDAFFKAVLVRRDDGSWSAAAFVMDNDSERYLLKDCIMTVDELERITGFDLYPALDDRIEEKVEGTLRRSDWGVK